MIAESRTGCWPDSVVVVFVTDDMDCESDAGGGMTRGAKGGARAIGGFFGRVSLWVSDACSYAPMCRRVANVCEWT